MWHLLKIQLSSILQYIRQQNQGSAVARNTGAKASRGDLLIFLDDDMLVEPYYVSGLLKEHAESERIVGMAHELPYVLPNALPFTRKAAKNALHQAVAPEGAFVDFTACVTNNLSIERDDFFEIGMMQDIAGDGPTWWGDVDFGYRALQAGFRFRRSGIAKCYHRDYSISSLEATASRYHKASRMAVLLFQKFPEIQSSLPMFYDKTPIKWGNDSPRLVTRKLVRQLASVKPMISFLERMVKIIEYINPSTLLLGRFYRWIIGGYIFQGYREGLREFGPIENS
ncbi:glycosyltransferase [Chloroflexi bacterium TSY]|nr:glycosyltransferase [Chloroflexi bacterium TSY]